jgi:hypothetical protein
VGVVINSGIVGIVGGGVGTNEVGSTEVGKFGGRGGSVGVCVVVKWITRVVVTIIGLPPVVVGGRT